MFQQFEQLRCLLAADGREVIQKFIERLARFEVIEQGLSGYTSTDEYRHPTENIIVSYDDLFEVRYRRHDRSPDADIPYY